MAASSAISLLDIKLRRFGVGTSNHELRLTKWKRKLQWFDGDQAGAPRRRLGCFADMLAPIRRSENSDERRFDQKTSAHGAGIKTSSSDVPFASPKSRFVSKQEKFYPRCTPRLTGPQSRDTPPKRDTGIANEKDWGMDLLNENVNESGTNEDGSSWFRESGQDLGDN